MQTETETQTQISTPSLFDINYQIRYVKCGKASIGTILIVLYRKINNFAKEWKIEDGKYEIFNHISSFYDNINKLYSDVLEVSTSFNYTELVKILFENKLEGYVWTPKDLQNMYVPVPGKFIDKCDIYELINLLYGKIRMWGEVIGKYGYNRKFCDDTLQLSTLFKSFVANLPERKEKISQCAVSRKNEEDESIEETMHDVVEYYEEFADLVFTNLRNIEIEERGNKKTVSNNRNVRDSRDNRDNRKSGNSSNKTSKN